MRCTRCGGELATLRTDLPFKVGASSIVILKGVPVVECTNCPEFLIEDEVMARLDEVLARLDGSVELEIVRFAA